MHGNHPVTRVFLRNEKWKFMAKERMFRLKISFLDEKKIATG